MTAQSLIFTAALGSVSVGCWWLNPALGLIVPGIIVLTLIVAWRFLGRDEFRRLKD